MTALLQSASVVIAVTLGRLAGDATREGLLKEEDLVLKALKIAVPELEGADDAQLAEYLGEMQSDRGRMRGLLSAVKGKYHELLLAKQENSDGDGIGARLAEDLNTPGYDIEFVVDGQVISQVQAKAVADPELVLEHLRRYPDIEVKVTGEVARMLDIKGVTGSGFLNEDLEEQVGERLGELAGEGLIKEVTDELMASPLVSAAIFAGKAARGELSESEMRSLAANAGAGITTAVLLEVLLSL